MIRKKKKKTKWYKQLNDDSAWWTAFDYIDMEGWHDHVLQQVTPKIPFDVALKEHEYVCISSGPAGPDRYPDLNFIKDDTYWIRKSRWSEDLVEIRGWFYKKKLNETKLFKHYFVISMECCKKYLKLKDNADIS